MSVPSGLNPAHGDLGDICPPQARAGLARLGQAEQRGRKEVQGEVTGGRNELSHVNFSGPWVFFIFVFLENIILFLSFLLIIIVIIN